MKPTTCAASLCALLVAGSPARAQPFPRNPKVDRIFAEWDKPDSPGCAVGGRAATGDRRPDSRSGLDGR